MQRNESEIPLRLITSDNTKTEQKDLAYSLILKQVCHNEKSYFLLAPNGKVFSLTDNQIFRIQFSVLIQKVCASSKTVFFIPDQGLYYQGRDILSNNFSYMPRLIPELSQLYLKDAGIGTTHASALDDLGTLYVWGASYGSPKTLTPLSFSQVKCENSITCLTTNGGYFYTHGWFNSEETGFSSLPDIEKYFILDFCVGSSFCGLVSDEGLVMVFDSSRSIVNLGSFSGVLSIHALVDGLIVTTKDKVYTWHGVGKWTGEELSFNGNFSVLGNGPNGIVVQGNFNWKKGVTIIDQASPQQMSSEKKNYSQCFPQDSTYNKLMNYRKQFFEKEKISKFLTKISLPTFSYSWERLKKYTDQKIILMNTRSFSELPLLIHKIYQKVTFRNLVFASDKIGMFVKELVRKEAESTHLKKNALKIRDEKFLECFKRVNIKEKAKYEEVILKVLKGVLASVAKRKNSVKRMLYYSKKASRSAAGEKFLAWVGFIKRLAEIEKGVLMINKLIKKKLEGFAFRLFNIFIYYSKVKLVKLKRALILLKNKKYVGSIIRCFGKWKEIGIRSLVFKEKSMSLYKFLAKNLFPVIQHKYRSNLKAAFFALLSLDKRKRQISNKSPLVILINTLNSLRKKRKISVFSDIKNLKIERFPNNLATSYACKNLFILLSSLSKTAKKSAFWALKFFVKSASVFFQESNENTLSFIHNQTKDFDLHFLQDQSIQCIKLNKVKFEPPRDTEKKKNFNRKTLHSASRSFSGVQNDSFAKRKNYDKQLKEKLKNYSRKINEDSLSLERTMVNKTYKRKYIKINREKKDFKMNDFLVKASIGVIQIQKFIEKKGFKLVLLSFKILKKCFKKSQGALVYCLNCSKRR